MVNAVNTATGTFVCLPGYAEQGGKGSNGQSLCAEGSGAAIDGGRFLGRDYQSEEGRWRWRMSQLDGV